MIKRPAVAKAKTLAKKRAGGERRVAPNSPLKRTATPAGVSDKDHHICVIQAGMGSSTKAAKGRTWRTGTAYSIELMSRAAQLLLLAEAVKADTAAFMLVADAPMDPRHEQRDSADARSRVSPRSDLYQASSTLPARKPHTMRPASPWHAAFPRGWQDF